MAPRQTVMKPGPRVLIGVVAAALWCCLGCGATPATSSVSASASTNDTAGANQHHPTTEQRLQTLAEQTARSLDGSIKTAQAVKSRHSTAERAISGDIVPGNEPVWAIQVEGAHEFVCHSCSYPAGAAPPRGRYFTLIVDAKTFATTDFGLDSSRADLAELGTVMDLGDVPAS
jgi:hypothetical protein